MTSEMARELLEDAEAAHEENDLVTAGDLYTRTAYAYVASGPYDPGGWTSKGLYCLLLAATAYKVAGRDQLCENRCRQGILIAEDVSERALAGSTPSNIYDDAKRGVWQEYIGDFRLVAGLDGADEAYDRATNVYVEAGDPETSYAEQETGWIMAYFREVARPTGMDVETLSEVQMRYPMSEWVAFKRDHLPEALETLVKRGSWGLVD